MGPLYKPKIRRIFDVSGAMDKVAAMPSEKTKILLNQTIEACLLEAPFEERLHFVNICISKLEDYKDQVPEELEELKKIAHILACNREHLSPEREFELADRLLTLYIGLSGGALIF